MADMTPERIAELRRLCEQADGGPWETDERGLIETARGGAVCTVAEMAEHGSLLTVQRTGQAFSHANAAFIAAARSALPEALDELERLHALARSVSGELQRTHESLAKANSDWSELRAENERLRAELASTRKGMRHPLDRKKKCPECGRMSRVTTAGCDHCDYEDK